MNNDDKYLQIANFCKQYKRPFSVLDLGSSEGYFTHRLASEFDGNFTMVGEDDDKKLRSICEDHNNDKVFLLGGRINLEKLKEMSEVHYFDVVLALNIEQDLEEHGQEARDIITSACSYCFCPELIENTKPKRIKKRWRYGNAYKDDEGIIINVSFEDISVEYKHREENRPWHLGMNLRTFIDCEGSYPTHDQIFEMIDEMDDTTGDRIDLAPHNMILDSGEIHLIDQNDEACDTPRRWFYIKDKEQLKSFLLSTFSFDLHGKNSQLFQKGYVTRDEKNEEFIEVVISLESGKPHVFSYLIGSRLLGTQFEFLTSALAKHYKLPMSEKEKAGDLIGFINITEELITDHQYKMPEKD